MGGTRGRAAAIAASLAFAGLLGGGAQAQTQNPPPPAQPKAPAPAPATTGTASVAGSFNAAIVQLGPGRAVLTGTLPGLAGPQSLKVPKSTDRDQLGELPQGDLTSQAYQARLEVDDVTRPTTVTQVDRVSRAVPASARLWALLVSLFVVVAVATVLTRFKPQKLLIGADNRYSNSQTQLALWSAAVAVVYLAAVGLRMGWLGGDFIGGVGLPANLIAMTGLSALSFGGAKVIVSQKVANAGAAAAAGTPGPTVVATPTGPAKPRAPKPNLLNDLFQNDAGRPDIGDLQMILVTVVAIIIFVLSSFNFLGDLQVASQTTLPDVDTALLSGFGIGQGAYLLKKAALPLGEG